MRYLVVAKYKDGARETFEVLGESIREALAKVNTILKNRSPQRFKNGVNDILWTDIEELE